MQRTGHKVKKAISIAFVPVSWVCRPDHGNRRESYQCQSDAARGHSVFRFVWNSLAEQSTSLANRATSRKVAGFVRTECSSTFHAENHANECHAVFMPLSGGFRGLDDRILSGASLHRNENPSFGGRRERILEKGVGLACPGVALGYAFERRLSGG